MLTQIQRENYTRKFKDLQAYTTDILEQLELEKDTEFLITFVMFSIFGGNTVNDIKRELTTLLLDKQQEV